MELLTKVENMNLPAAEKKIILDGLLDISIKMDEQQGYIKKLNAYVSKSDIRISTLEETISNMAIELFERRKTDE